MAKVMTELVEECPKRTFYTEKDAKTGVIKVIRTDLVRLFLSNCGLLQTVTVRGNQDGEISGFSSCKRLDWRIPGKAELVVIPVWFRHSNQVDLEQEKTFKNFLKIFDQLMTLLEFGADPKKPAPNQLAYFMKNFMFFIEVGGPGQDGEDNDDDDEDEEVHEDNEDDWATTDEEE